MNFRIKKSSNGQFYFTVEAANGKVLATSETYWNKGDCSHGLNSSSRMQEGPAS
jgi:uncharacterized protein YegP (UPF0339 family)